MNGAACLSTNAGRQAFAAVQHLMSRRGPAQGGTMTSAITMFGIAVGATSLVCYLLMTRLQNRRTNRGPSRDGSGADGGNDVGGDGGGGNGGGD